MSDFFGEELFSAAFADQVAFDIPDGSPSWTHFLSTLPAISLNREVEDLKLGTGQDFAVQPRKVGSKHGGTVVFSVPLRSQLSTYDPSAGAPVKNPEVILLEELIGTSITGAYAAAPFAAASDARTWNLTSISPDVGSMYIAELAGIAKAIGWVKKVTAGTPNVIDLQEDGVVIPDAADNLVQSITMYGDGSQPTPKTFRLKGISDDHDVWLIGCIPEGVTITMDAGELPTAEFTYRFTDWLYKTASGDGLLTATDYVRLPPILGVHTGRVWINGIVDSDGTAEPEGTCGLGSFQIEIGCVLADLRCHSASQGVSDIVVQRRTAKASFTIPHTIDWIVAEDSKWEDSLENGTPLSLSMQVGAAPGQIFAMVMPAGVVSAQPDYGPNDGLIGWSVEMEPDEFTGDDVSTNAGNTAFRLAVA